MAKKKKKQTRVLSRVDIAIRLAGRSQRKPFPDRREKIDPAIGARIAKDAKPRTWGGLGQ